MLRLCCVLSGYAEPVSDMDMLNVVPCSAVVEVLVSYTSYDRGVEQGGIGTASFVGR